MGNKREGKGEYKTCTRHISCVVLEVAGSVVVHSSPHFHTHFFFCVLFRVFFFLFLFSLLNCRIPLLNLFRPAEVAQHQVAEEAEDDEECQQQDRVGPQRKPCTACRFENVVGRYPPGRVVDARVEPRIPLGATVVIGGNQNEEGNSI